MSDDRYTPPDGPIMKWIKRLMLLAIVLIMIGIVISSYSGSRSTPQSRTHGITLMIAHALERYREEFGTVPSGDARAVRAALLGDNPRNKAILYPQHDIEKDDVFVDAWGTPIRIDLSDSEHIRVWSCGKNKIDEGGAEGSDDVASWR